MRNYLFILWAITAAIFISCTESDKPMTEKSYPVHLITLDPGHFHAGLVQKRMYPQIDPEVYVYAPKGKDLDMHLQRISQYNERAQQPTSWEEIVFTGPDFFEKMLSEKKGNLVVLSGNNERKTEYILRSLENGFNVLADKPMVITREDFNNLLTAFKVAGEKDLLLYDIMTERFEITSILQKELSHRMDIFGELEFGSAEEPAVTKESVHHFFKYVSGEPLVRPPWFFDVEQQGEGIVDVSTHLVDLIHWACFPEEIIEYQNDVTMVSADRWATVLSPEEFKKVTGLDEYPTYLAKDIQDSSLHVFSNGKFTYQVKGVFARVSVVWNFQAPEGTGDTHYSIMRGTRSNLIISQQAEENFQPTLYVELKENDNAFGDKLRTVLENDLASQYPGLTAEKMNDRKWRVMIPDKYKVGHEAHFGQVMDQFLEYFMNGNMPAWEVPNMISKYYITTSALEMALQNQSP